LSHEIIPFILDRNYTGALFSLFEAEVNIASLGAVVPEAGEK
jgi:hypothetical protein